MLVSTWRGREQRVRRRRRMMKMLTTVRSRGGKRDWRESSGSENRWAAPLLICHCECWESSFSPVEDKQAVWVQGVVVVVVVSSSFLSGSPLTVWTENQERRRSGCRRWADWRGRQSFYEASQEADCQDSAEKRSVWYQPSQEKSHGPQNTQ